MKKNMCVFILALVGISLIVTSYYVFIQRNPSRIIQQVFNIEMRNFNYKVISFDEKWLPNGDGYCSIKLEFNSFSQENLLYLKEKMHALPIKEKNKIPYKYLNINNGFYVYETFNDDDRNYKLFIIDTTFRQGYVYYDIQ